MEGTVFTDTFIRMNIDVGHVISSCFINSISNENSIAMSHTFFKSRHFSGTAHQQDENKSNWK